MESLSSCNAQKLTKYTTDSAQPYIEVTFLLATVYRMWPLVQKMSDYDESFQQTTILTNAERWLMNLRKMGGLLAHFRVLDVSSYYSKCLDNGCIQTMGHIV